MSNIQAYQPIIEDGLGIFPEDLRFKTLPGFGGLGGRYAC